MSLVEVFLVKILLRFVISIFSSVEILCWIVDWLGVLARAVVLLARAVRICFLLVLLSGFCQLFGWVVYFPAFAVLT